MRVKKGEVKSTKQDKTVVVTVHEYVSHPKYKKRYRKSRNYQVHNPQNLELEVGSEVTFYETNPISKTKSWTLEAPETKESK